MIKIEAIVRDELYEDLMQALKSVAIHGVTVSQVMGCGTSLDRKSVV